MIVKYYSHTEFLYLINSILKPCSEIFKYFHRSHNSVTNVLESLIPTASYNTISRHILNFTIQHYFQIDEQTVEFLASSCIDWTTVGQHSCMRSSELPGYGLHSQLPFQFRLFLIYKS